MTSLVHFLHAFRGFVAALVVLIAGASITGPGTDPLSADAREPVGLSFGADSSGVVSSGAGSSRTPHRVGRTRSSPSTAGAWRESSRRAPVEVEATKIEVDVERDDVPPEPFGALSVVGNCPAFETWLRPPLPALSASVLAAPYFETSRPRGPPTVS